MAEEPTQIDPKIRFLLSVPDWKPEEASPFQGFSMSLCRNGGFLRFVHTFPTDIYELTPESLPSRIGRRIAGQLPIEWHGQSPRALKFMPAPIEMPFTVIILADSEKVADYQEWLDNSTGTVTVVAKDGGHIPYEKLSFDALRSRFLEVCDELVEDPNLEGVGEAKAAIESWQLPDERELPYKLGGHGTIFPNLAALGVCGFGSLVDGPFTRLGDESAHIEQIVQTCSSVLDEREGNPPSEANRLFPRTPDLNLYLPSTYDLKTAFSPRAGIDPATRKDMTLTLRMIEKQDSYSFVTNSPAQMKAMMGRFPEELKAGAEPVGNPIMRIRQLEVNLGTEAVSCLAASEIGAVIRLPNRMNRTRGIVRGFAQHYRADRPQLLKRAELFRGVQKAIADGFPEEFFEILDRSSDGVRIIADAHIEWLDVRGIPLGLRYNVSRVPVTPGNLFIESVGMKEPLFVIPDAFGEILVISGLEEEDMIAKQFQVAFDHFGKLWHDKIKLKFVRVRTRKEMVDAINAFRGMLMVFDGHGSHRKDEPSVLWLGDEAVDIWELRGEITRPPPVVLLSACDTHAADRNHATVANGFLMLGTRSVIGSVFPLHATHAAVFAARLLYRVSEFIPAAVKMYGRSITWLEVVSGMLRRQALTDILHHLESKDLVPQDWSVEATIELQMLADVSGPDPFANVQAEMAKWGLPMAEIEREIHSALASSSTISYLHLGRPETIIINSVKNLQNFFAEEDDG
ncbi:CHAT domain-containing protein [Tsuneonella flava]|uniref:CHAT domain-containing protein n=1 Tax=Tsuneonella flava TaxID=2055955 RepID=A0ABX7K6Z5_9SPHN|nr:CHAT domain-containing protein [Tsuneonella flava]QSB44019.1 CHAT domain-containing protein [Tsuneonella flava]